MVCTVGVGSSEVKARDSEGVKPCAVDVVVMAGIMVVLLLVVLPLFGIASDTTRN